MLNEICSANLKKPEIALNVISVLIKLAENEMCARVMSENRIVQTTAQTLNMCRDDRDLVISCLYLLTNLVQFRNYVAFAETTLIVDCAELLQENVKYAVDNNTETVESKSAVEIVTLSSGDIRQQWSGCYFGSNGYVPDGGGMSDYRLCLLESGTAEP